MLHYLERLLSSEEVDQVWEIHCEMMLRFGFDRLIYAYLPFQSTNGADSLDDIFILSNRGSEYLSELLATDSHGAVSIVPWITESPNELLWSQAPALEAQGRLSAADRRYLAINHRYGLMAGISLAFSDPAARARARISLGARSNLSQDDVDRIWQDHGSSLRVMNQIAHMRIASLPQAASRRVLTDRQKEVLEWVADGKTIADIALLMGLKAATIEKHLRLAREALDVGTTAQAVLKATLLRKILLPG